RPGRRSAHGTEQMPLRRHSSTARCLKTRRRRLTYRARSTSVPGAPFAQARRAEYLPREDAGGVAVVPVNVQAPVADLARRLHLERADAARGRPGRSALVA